MSEGLKNARNAAIVLAIAAAVYFIPGGGRAANTFEAALVVAFGLGAGYLGLRLYREHRMTLDGLGDRHRGLLYGAVAVAIFLWAAHTRMWETGVGTIAWFVLAGIAVYSLLAVFRHWRAY